MEYFWPFLVSLQIYKWATLHSSFLKSISSVWLVFLPLTCLQCWETWSHPCFSGWVNLRGKIRNRYREFSVFAVSYRFLTYYFIFSLHRSICGSQLFCDSFLYHFICFVTICPLVTNELSQSWLQMIGSIGEVPSCWDLQVDITAPLPWCIAPGNKDCLVVWFQLVWFGRRYIWTGVFSIF